MSMTPEERRDLEEAIDSGVLTFEQRQEFLWLLHQVADAHMLAGRYARAEHYLRKAVDEVPDLPPDLSDLYLYYIGVCEVCTGRFVRGLTRAMETLDDGLAHHSHSPRRLLSPLIVMARALHVQDPRGNAERVDGLFDQVEKSMAEHPDPAGYLSFLYSRLRVQVDRGNAHAARELLSRCEAAERTRRQMRPEEWRLHRCLVARLFIAEGDHLAAGELGHKVLAESREDRPNLQTCWAARILAHVAGDAQKADDALESSRTAEHEALELQSPLERAGILKERVDILTPLGRGAEAAAARRDALGLAERMQLIGLQRELTRPRMF